MGILLTVFSGFALAVIAPFVTRPLGKAAGWVFGLVPAAIVVYLTTYINRIAEEGPIVIAHEWVSVTAFDVSLGFYVDGLSLFFALLITGIGFLIYVYAGGYLEGHHHLGRFYCYLSIFMASMVGLVLANNLFTFYIFFELTSFASFVLIGFNHYAGASRRAAWQALLVTKAGGLAMLVGFLMMHQITGTAEISAIIAQGDLIRESVYYLPILLLVMAGAFTKSAQFPFYFWLPNAMEAPTPVSAYLHSATMVKAGIYVLARLHPALAGTEAWVYLITGFGAVTMLLGAWLALQYTDMKSILAYTTIMALGLITMLLGLDTDTAVIAAMLFVLVHALYKAGLFMVAGAVDHATHVRDLTKLGGLRKVMPITAGAAVLAGLSMAGISPFLGFIGKETIYEAALHGDVAVAALVTVAVLSNVALVALAGLLVIRPFFGERTPATEHAHGASVSLWFGPALLGVLGLLLGIFPNLFDASLLAPMAGAVLGEQIDLYLSLWHGFNTELVLSIITVALGVALYFAWDAMRANRFFQGFERWLGTGLDNGYDHTVDGLMAFGIWQTRVLQSGVLRRYLAIIVSTLLVLVAYSIFRAETFGIVLNFEDILLHEWGLAFLIVAAVLAMVFLQSRMSIVVALGIMGFSIALLYLAYGAPDLAMTQFLVETLTVILFVLVLIAVPKVKVKEKVGGRMRDAAIAISTGAVISLIILAVLNVPFFNRMGNFYAENSYVLAEGRNIVNTILVDFRALDTLGEITVLLVAGFGIYALIRMRSVEEAPSTEPAPVAVEEQPEHVS